MISFLKKLFSTQTQEAQPVNHFEYKDYLITPKPKKTSSGYRAEALIEKKVHDDTLQHHFIRADTTSSFDECVVLIERKTKLVIDQLGDSIFSR